ncbi:hypothetical protein KAU19_07060 [Candidatus Parcubacteria bacterium]|nr:hypothetical protein [Candidatus Parcubacteria bacterium]
MIIIQQAYNKAINVLESCVKPAGLYASGLPGGYEAVWARDSMITSLGAILIDKKFKPAIVKSIALLAKNQGEMGQIPNCVGSYNIDRRSDVTYNSVDSSLWFIIGSYIYAKQFNDTALLKKYQKNIRAAYCWLRSQDPDNVGLIAQQPTNDWQDAFPHKYGYTIHIHALYYAVLKMIGDKKRAEEVKKIINGEKRKYCSLYNAKLGYYYPWAWKNHDSIREHEEWFDSAGNLLAIITGLATPPIAKRILSYIEKQKVNRPYPCKAIWPPIKKGDKEWYNYFALCDASTPYHYLNAGIWPFIGGLYVAALVKMKQYKKAQAELELLAKANMQKLKIRDFKAGYEFNEWLRGKTGKPMGEPYQAWSAGMYVYAYECVRRKKVLFF